MKYRVIVTPQAQVDIRNSFKYIYERAPSAAVVWIQSLYDRIDSLERLPARYGFAREQDYLEEDLRQAVFKSHRIFFWIEEPRKKVYVLYVRHAKQHTVGEIHE